MSSLVTLGRWISARLGDAVRFCGKRLLDAVGYVAKNKRLYAIVTIVGVVLTLFGHLGPSLASRFPWIGQDIGPVYVSYFWLKAMFFDIPLPHTFMFGVAQSTLASLWFAWTAYLNRALIRSLLKPPALRMIAPMSVAMTPVLLARDRKLWEDHDINLDLDFSMTGYRALEELSRGKCHIAIAGDYAFCHFLGAQKLHGHEWEHLYLVLPFARVRDQVKLLARKKPGSIAPPALSALRGQRVAYWENSVQAEFLKKIELDCKCGASDNAPLINFIADVASDEAKACVLVEPYFLAKEKVGFETIDVGANGTMDWYMCAVLKKNSFEKYAETESALRTVIAEACKAVENDRNGAMKICARFILCEFTGIDGDALAAEYGAQSMPSKKELEDPECRKPTIDFRQLTQDEFIGRMDRLKSDESVNGLVRQGATVIYQAKDRVLL
jgi:hypothetical protein